MLTPQPVTLSGSLVRLEPLDLEHLPQLTKAALDQRIWGYALQPMASEADVRAYIDSALTAQAAGSALPFAQIHIASGLAVGSTRFGNISVPDSRVEIGWTWLNPAYQRSGMNTEAKLLMLTHAFETLGALRVEFKGDAQNSQSRNALERIGAKFEGVLRQHMRKADGVQRDSFYYSVIASEWPETKKHIEGLLR